MFSKIKLPVNSREMPQSTALQFSPDGTQLASAGFDRSVHLWSLATREDIKSLIGHSQIIDQILFSPDGKCLLVADAIETKLWNLTDETITFHTPQAKCPMAFTPDGKTLITAPGEVHFWQVATGDELLTFPHYGYDSRTLSISPTGNALAQAGGNRDESNGVESGNGRISDAIALELTYRYFLQRYRDSPPYCYS